MPLTPVSPMKPGPSNQENPKQALQIVNFNASSSPTKCTKPKPQTTLSTECSPTLAASPSTSSSNNPSTNKNNDNEDFEHIEKKSD
ncbi:uncharacterized protein ARMOST_03231 [Armillaria ostoyae]|uniref:Uncharacterized protein n=1 Tax=Armillaria ostoyae TaxID=47428 RepID=A0A284QTW9_ARMOS|nr:uncharacterized protein ARMOST_03231 [Armillaria ostoyae]